MYKFNISVENPLTGESEWLRFQFDPDTFDVKKWENGFLPVREAIDKLVSLEATPDRLRPVTL